MLVKNTQHSEFAGQRPWMLKWCKVERENTWTSVYLVAVHVLALVGIVLFPTPGWKVLLVALILAGVGGFGTTIGYHRAVAHRAVKLNPMLFGRWGPSVS